MITTWQRHAGLSLAGWVLAAWGLATTPAGAKDASKEAAWGTGDPGYKIKAEFNSKSHVRGVLSMARSNDPNSAGSQFFICHGDPKFLDNQYTTFGKLIKGDDVLEKIATTPTKPGCVTCTPSGLPGCLSRCSSPASRSSAKRKW